MIDLVKLNVFLYSAETLSFSEAGKRLHLTQPTISHHIKVLEQELGVVLFERSGAGLHLTEAGYLLLPWARKLINQSIEIQDMMASLQDKIVGHLRIACSTTSGKYLLPQLAARFHQRHPWVKVTILSCTSEHVVPQLLEEEANLGVLSRETTGTDLEIQEFFEDYIILIASSEHPWASRQSVVPADLLEVPFILREPTSGTRKVMVSELGKYDITLDDLDIFLELGNAEAIVQTVAAGFGVSFVSRLAAACALRRKEVVEIPIADLELRRKIFMVRRTIELPNRAQEVFWGFVHDPANTDLLQLAKYP
ncbi:MAG: LysR substrate-binding domain-containing protein [Anaerolineales bacterium]|jgi:DNA-binding transcriptional LysR family regulator